MRLYTDGPHSTAAESSLYALSATRECKPEGVFFKPGFTGLTASKPGYPGGRYSTSGGHTGGASGAVHQGPHDPWGPTSEDEIAIFFEKLTLSSAESSTDDIIYQSAVSLVATYFNDLSDSFTTQLLSRQPLTVHCLRTI